jgi:alkylation response protein AidB-like acyl-CoA dehydrogenase
LDFDVTDEQRVIRAAVAAAGWLGITMPEQYGGAGLDRDQRGQTPLIRRFAAVRGPQFGDQRSLTPLILMIGIH